MCALKKVKAELMMPLVKDILKSGGSTRITVTGMSMVPFLRENIDSVELSPISFEMISLGDIVMVLRDTGEYVLHRVLRKEKDCFFMIGDAQHWIEGPLRPDQLVAGVTAVCRRNTRIDCSATAWRLLSMLWIYMLPLRISSFKLRSFLHRKLFTAARRHSG
ncbi:MAG: S24/S26 family peptidase [Clostridia bacterium]|nr:S24/S26 family peptidase [Clostridia bacterium]